MLTTVRVVALFLFELFCTYFHVSLIFHVCLFVSDCESDAKLLANWPMWQPWNKAEPQNCVIGVVEGWPKNLRHLGLFHDNKLMENSDQPAPSFEPSPLFCLTHPHCDTGWKELYWPQGSARWDQRLFTRGWWETGKVTLRSVEVVAVYAESQQ